MASHPTPPAPPRRRARRWRRRLTAVALVAAVAYLARAPLLRTGGAVLVSDDGLAPATRVAVLDGDRRFEVAAALVTAGRADGVLIVQGAPARTVLVGLRPSPEDVGRAELSRRGVPDARVEMIPA